jgi:hypothetical protein
LVPGGQIGQLSSMHLPTSSPRQCDTQVVPCYLRAAACGTPHLNHAAVHGTHLKVGHWNVVVFSIFQFSGLHVHYVMKGVCRSCNHACFLHALAALRQQFPHLAGGNSMRMGGGWGALYVKNCSQFPTLLQHTVNRSLNPCNNSAVAAFRGVVIACCNGWLVAYTSGVALAALKPTKNRNTFTFFSN